MSIIQSHQLDIGTNPGQVPAFSDAGTLPLNKDPINDNDAVTLKYVKQLFSGYSNNDLNLDTSQPVIQKLQEQIDNNINVIQILQNKISELETTLQLITTPSLDIPINLIDYKTYIKHKINQAITDIRTKYITNVLGQSDVYSEKIDQAIDYLSHHPSSPIDMALYPLIRIDAEVYEITYEDAANQIIQQKKEWMKYTCSTEKLRLMIKKQVDLAPTIIYIDNLYTQFLIDLTTL